jgi:hypothetical protein
MHVAAENIDRVMNIEIRRAKLPRGNKWPMYMIAREAEDEPLVLAATAIPSIKGA